MSNILLARTLGAKSTRDGIQRIVCAAAAVWASFCLYAEALGRYASARFWESWVRPGGSFAVFAPPCLIALLCGIVIGIILAAVIRVHAIRVAAAAAFIELLYAVTAALLGDHVPQLGLVGLVTTAALATGLLVGTCLLTAARFQLIGRRANG